MANPEHVEQLKQSVKKWMRQQYNNPNIEHNFSGADLSGVDLSQADLSGVDLSFANLSDANLSNVDLSNVDLSDADLNGADFHNTDLSDANLYNADFRGANLLTANLSGANLNRANLSGADLSGAFLYGATLIDVNLNDTNLNGTYLSHTIFAKVDLCSSKGLAQINHMDRCIVETHSIQLPQDGRALHFLRGAGIPDEWIDFYRAMMMHPIQYYLCFLSYSSVDEGIAKRLHADLQANGVRCWFAPHDLKPGNYIRKEIDQAIHLQDKLLLILSESAINSGWVSHEVELAIAKEIRQQREILFPIRLDDEVLQSSSHWATTLQATRHIGDFTNWTDAQTYQQIFDRLLRDLKKADV